MVRVGKQHYRARFLRSYRRKYSLLRGTRSVRLAKTLGEKMRARKKRQGRDEREQSGVNEPRLFFYRVTSPTCRDSSTVCVLARGYRRVRIRCPRSSSFFFFLSLFFLYSFLLFFYFRPFFGTRLRARGGWATYRQRYRALERTTRRAGTENENERRRGRVRQQREHEREKERERDTVRVAKRARYVLVGST